MKSNDNSLSVDPTVALLKSCLVSVSIFEFHNNFWIHRMLSYYNSHSIDIVRRAVY